MFYTDKQKSRILLIYFLSLMGLNSIIALSESDYYYETLLFEIKLNYYLRNYHAIQSSNLKDR